MYRLGDPEARDPMLRTSAARAVPPAAVSETRAEVALLAAESTEAITSSEEPVGAVAVLFLPLSVGGDEECPSESLRTGSSGRDVRLTLTSAEE